MSPEDPDTLDRLEALSERCRSGGDPSAVAAQLGLDLEVARRYLRAQARLLPFGDAPEKAETHVSGFRVLEELGRGGMGCVYRAEDAEGNLVALKVLLTDHQRSAARFAREARVLARLTHPHIVRFKASGHDGSRPWLAMELVEGRDLLRRLEDGPLDPEDARVLIGQVGSALAHAHAHGVIHRDLKPSNVLLANDGRALVTDFGVARVCAESGLTQTGAMVGTPTYMAPEQIEGGRAGEAADVWALGVLLYQCLTGDPPFQAEFVPLLADRIRTAPMPALGRDVPRDLEAICRACLSKDPAQRPTPQRVIADLASRSARPRLRRRLAALGLASALLALVVVGTRGFDPLPLPSGSTPVPAPAAWRPLPLAGSAKVWDLASGQPPRLEARSLWAIPGRVADPLRGARGQDDSALTAAFNGEVSRLSRGRLRVLYRLPEVGQVQFERYPEHFAPYQLEGRSQVYQAPAVSASPGGCTIYAPDDHGAILIRVGRADWRHPAIELEAQALPHPHKGAYRLLSLELGPRPGAGARLSLAGRPKSIGVSLGKASGGGHFDLPRTWTLLRLAPGAASGERFRVGPDHPAAPELESALAQAAPPGGVWISVAEERVALRNVEVSGVPLSVDAPALAWAPATGGTHCGITVRFRLEGAAAEARGGPRLEIGPPALRYVLRLDGQRLWLDRGQRPLAVGSLPGTLRAGWLQLIRDGDSVRGVLGDDSGLVCEVSAQDPLPLGPGDVSLGYGSNGPRIRFAQVEVHRAPEDPARRTHDRGDPSTPERGAGLWRQASSTLWTLTFPSKRAVEEGPKDDARRRVAAGLAEQLEGSVADLAGDAAADAQARATLAWVVAERPEQAKAAAARLVALEGAGGARRLDWLTTYMGRPTLLETLARGYGRMTNRPGLREAACGVVSAVGASRELRSLALQRLADLYEADSRTASLALKLLDQAASLDGSNWEVQVRAARVAVGFGRNQEALDRLEQAQAPDGDVMRLQVRLVALVHLGRLEAAIETLAAMLTRNPALTRETIQRFNSPRGRRMPVKRAWLVKRLLEARPAYRATLTLLLSRLPSSSEQDVQFWRDKASTHSRSVYLDGAQPSARDLALARYVEAAAVLAPSLGDFVAGGAPKLPSEVLLRARVGDMAARRELAIAGREDPLVQDLARGDELLANWAR